MPAYLDRMPAGIPGRVTRRNGVTLEPALLGQSMLFGAPGKITDGTFVPLEDGDDIDDLYGFLATQWPTQSDMVDLGGGSAPAGTMHSVMRRGYMTVKIADGTAELNAPVYVQLAGADVGALSASTGTAIPGCTFMGAADGDGNVEISFNI